MAEQTQVELLIRDVRLSYWAGYRPNENEDENGKKTQSYGTHFLMSRDHPGVQQIKDAMRQVASAKWGANAEGMLKALADDNRTPLKDGNKKRKQDGSVADGYADMLFVSANRKDRVRCYEERLNTVSGKYQNFELSEADGKPYSGCYADVKVAIYVYDPQGEKAKRGKRIICQLQGVKFRAHGDAFGGTARAASADEFGIDGAAADAPAPAASGDSLI